MKWTASNPISPARASDDAVRILVKHGYHPHTVLAQAGRPLRITFRREESSPCSERVFLSGFEVAAALPQGQDVTVELRPEEAGEHEFTCSGQRCCVGRVIVTPPGQEPAAAA